MTIGAGLQIEKTFLSLSRAEREAIISHGAAIRLSALKNRQFLAQSKVRCLEEKYKTTVEQLEDAGLPDDASVEMHEDYVMWRHWHDTLETLAQDIGALEKIAGQGLCAGQFDSVGH
jgi:hypothetical protein